MALDFLFFPLFVVLVAITGLGFSLIAKWASGINPLSIEKYALPLLGLFSIGAIALVVNFFAGVYNVITYLSMFILLVLGLFSIDRPTTWYLGLLALLSVGVTPLVVSMPAGYDGGLYHLPHQKWLREEPIVVGLANLHGRYGFGSFQEYIAAPLWIESHFKFLSYLVGTFIVSLLAFLHSKIRLGDSMIRSMALLVTLNLIVFNGYFKWGYTYTDSTAGVIFAISFIVGLQMLVSIPSNEKCKIQADIFLFIMLAIMAVVIKKSAIIILFWLSFVILAQHIRGVVSYADIIKCAIIPALFSVIWAIKSIVTTGCIAYPTSWSCLNLPWSATAHAISDEKWVTAWARHPRSGLYSLEDWSWLSNYWLDAYTGLLSNLGLAMIAVLSMNLIGGIYLGYEKRRRYEMTFALLFILSSLTLWFLKAPTPRFGIGVFIIFAPVLVILVLGAPRLGGADPWRWIATGLICFLVLRIDGNEWSGIKSMTAFDSRTVPIVEVVDTPTFGYRPKNGDQCWLAEHCAPYRRPAPERVWGYFIFSHD